MKTYEVNIQLKRNRTVTLYLSPNKDEDIFVDEKTGGVPFQLIEGKRYYYELSDAAQAIELVDRAYIYDNSIENALPQLLYRTVDGEVFKQYTDDVPEWAEMLVE